MGVNVFIDTNILLRVLMPEMKHHHQTDALIKQAIHAGNDLWINGQVIREFIVQVTHPKTLNTPLTTVQAVQQIEAIKPLFRIADETALVRENLLALLIQYPTQGKQVHDVNIVATMLAYDINILFTLNADDFNRFETHIKIVMPE